MCVPQRGVLSLVLLRLSESLASLLITQLPGERGRRKSCTVRFATASPCRLTPGATNSRRLHLAELPDTRRCLRPVSTSPLLMRRVRDLSFRLPVCCTLAVLDPLTRAYSVSLPCHPPSPFLLASSQPTLTLQERQVVRSRPSMTLLRPEASSVRILRMNEQCSGPSILAQDSRILLGPISSSILLRCRRREVRLG